MAAPVKIDRKLNLLLPVYEDDMKTVKAHVYSQPIGVAVWERYFDVMTQTFARIYQQGIGRAGGQSIAYLMLKKIAEENGTWDGDAGVEKGLVEEIRRLTMVVAPGPKGWRQIPWHAAVKHGVFTDEEQLEVENVIVFFIVSSRVFPKTGREAMLAEALNLWGAQTSSSTLTEFIASLPMSTGTGTSEDGAEVIEEAQQPQPSAPAGPPAAVGHQVRAPGPQPQRARPSSIPY